MSVLGQHTDPVDATARKPHGQCTLALWTCLHARTHVCSPISTALGQPQSVSWSEYKSMISLIGQLLDS